ncbi:MAG: hypothetical protein KGD67_08165 [Candidatus Lokiarchaeota archaeon]|nr:hypothetical protein [Candidatus Lokiarchaeota archaeon]
MVHIEVTSWFPSLKNQEVTDKYLAILQDPGMPSTVKSLKIFTKAHRKGYQTKAYLEIEPGKLDEAFTDLAPIMALFSEIEGYSFEYGIALSIEESLAAQQ